MSTATQHPDALRRRIRRLAAIAAGAGIGAAAYAGIASAGLLDAPSASPADRAPRSAPLVERPGCPTDAGADGAEMTNAVGAVQVVDVTVRPTALVWVDGRGRVTGAWTNTGCAPRRTDDLFVQRPDGTIRPASRDLVERRWTGDFREPGVRVDQRPAG